MTEELVTIRTYVSDTKATMAKAALEGSGIEVMMQKDDAGGWRPYLEAISPIRLLVRPQDAARANEILTAAETARGD